MSPTIHLQFTDLMIAALLVLASSAASWALKIQIQRQVLIAAVRMVIQLLLVGWVLRWVFQSASAGMTVLVVVFMIAAAAREVAVRPHKHLRRGGN